MEVIIAPYLFVMVPNLHRNGSQYQEQQNVGMGQVTYPFQLGFIQMSPVDGFDGAELETVTFVIPVWVWLPSETVPLLVPVGIRLILNSPAVTSDALCL